MAMLTSRLQSLAEMVAKRTTVHHRTSSHAISARVAILESSGQANELVRQFRNTFNRPNAAIMIGSTWFRRLSVVRWFASGRYVTAFWEPDWLETPRWKGTSARV